MNGEGDDELLSGYFDGRLEGEEKQAFERRLADEPALARRLRLLRAMKAALAAAAPALPRDLKEELKRAARARGGRRAALLPSWAGLSLGAAFAAAATLLTLRSPLPRPSGRPAARPAPGAPAAAVWRDRAAAEGLKALWSDDDGRDEDEG